MQVKESLLRVQAIHELSENLGRALKRNPELKTVLWVVVTRVSQGL